MIKGSPATAEATATPGASATTEMQNYPASDSDPSGASDVVLLCQITGSDPASLDHWRKHPSCKVKISLGSSKFHGCVGRISGEEDRFHLPLMGFLPSETRLEILFDFDLFSGSKK